jgi:hypothetical protein
MTAGPFAAVVTPTGISEENNEPSAAMIPSVGPFITAGALPDYSTRTVQRQGNKDGTRPAAASSL